MPSALCGVVDASARFSRIVLIHAVASQRRAYLQQAVQQIKSSVDKTDGGSDASKTFSPEIMILCAEAACRVRDMLHEFFTLTS